MKIDIAESRAYLAARQAEEAQVRERRRVAALAAARAAAQAVLPRFPAVCRAYCFGSVVRPGGMRATSDVDIALEAGTYFAIWRALEREMGPWELDVIELGPDIHFAARVRAQGELIYERADPDS
jgi:predicted nucleotidyltransferase